MGHVEKANLFEASMMLRFKAAVAVWWRICSSSLKTDGATRNHGGIKMNKFLETEAELLVANKGLYSKNQF